MGLFSKGPSMDELEQRNQSAKFQLDCTNSIRIIISLKKNIEALQRFVELNNHETAQYVANECCKNPIISCSKNELPFAGLVVIQQDILASIYNCNPDFRSNPAECMFDIALRGKILYIMQACNDAIKQIEQARKNGL